MSKRESATGAGVRAILPLSIGIFPFGLVYGVAVANSSIPDWIGGLASTLILAGAAQLALVDLIDQGAPAVVAVATALVINVRFVMYSAALAPAFSEFPPRSRVPLAHLMTDQTAVTAMIYNERAADPGDRIRFYAGAGTFFALSWMAGTWMGIIFGSAIPGTWPLGFVIPLMFLALLVPSIRDRAGLVAAIVSGVVTMIAAGAPYNTGLIVGALAGIAAGVAIR